MLESMRDRYQQGCLGEVFIAPDGADEAEFHRCVRELLEALHGASSGSFFSFFDPGGRFYQIDVPSRVELGDAQAGEIFELMDRAPLRISCVNPRVSRFPRPVPAVDMD